MALPDQTTAVGANGSHPAAVFVQQSNSSKKTRASRRLVLISSFLILCVIAIIIRWGWIRWKSHQERELAQESIRQFDFDQAIIHLRNYVEFRPDEPDGLLLLARTYRRANRIHDAELTLQHFQQIGGSSTSASFERDLLLLQQGEIGEIDVRLRSTIKPEQEEAQYVLESLGNAYLSRERLPDLLEAARLLTNHNPNHPWPWLWNGIVSERNNQLDTAETAYRKALALAPKYVDTHILLGQVLLSRRQPLQAVEYFEYTLSKRPDNQQALLGLAYCRLESNQPDEAISLLQRVIQKDTSSAEAYYLLGKAYLLKDQPVEAERWFRRSLFEKADNPTVLYLLIQSLQTQRKDAEAKELTTKLDKLREDIRRFDELVRKASQEPENLDACLEAGRLAMQLGWKKETVNWLKNALRRKGDHRPVHRELAKYYQSIGDVSRAQYHSIQAERP